MGQGPAEREAATAPEIEFAQLGVVEQLPGHRRHAAETGGPFPLGEAQELGHVPLAHQRRALNQPIAPPTIAATPPIWNSGAAVIVVGWPAGEPADRTGAGSGPPRRPC